MADLYVNTDQMIQFLSETRKNQWITERQYIPFAEEIPHG